MRYQPWRKNLLLCCILSCGVVNVLASLGELWKIGNPKPVWSLPHSADDKTTNTEDMTNGEQQQASSDDMMNFQLEYTISHFPKNARYRILKKGCREYYKPGREPVIAKAPIITEKDSSDTSVDQGASTAMYVPIIEPSPTNEGKEQIVKAKFVAKPPSSSLYTSVMGGDDDDGQQKENVVEFCIRLGVFLPPEAGNMEVNFRETDIKLSFEGINDMDENNSDVSSTTGNDNDGTSIVDTVWSYVEWAIAPFTAPKPVRLKNVDATPCALREVDVKLFGKVSASEQPKKDEEEDIENDVGTDNNGDEDSSDTDTATPDLQQQDEL